MRLRSTLLVSLFLATVPVAYPGGAAVGRWVPGDLHVHTTYSSNVCPAQPVFSGCDPARIGGTPAEIIAEAEMRGLEFVAITDHDVPAATFGPSAQSDPDVVTYKQCHLDSPGDCPVLVLDGTEKTFVDSSGYPTGRGGAVGFSGPYPVDPTPASAGWSAADVSSSVAKVRTAGGLVVAFAPTTPAFGYDPATVALDGYEIWNGAWADQSEFNGGGATDNPRADDTWQRTATALTSTAKRLPLTGGSDAHWKRDGQIQGVGQPTLWVYDTLDAGAVTWAGLRDGIAKGHVFVSFDPPARGPRLYLETTTGGLMAGDTVPKTPVNRTVRIRWAHAPAGAIIRLYGSNGLAPVSFVETGPRLTVVCDPPSESDLLAGVAWGCDGSEEITLQFAPASRWYRAQMYLEDAAASQPGAAAAAPSRANAPCLPLAIAPGGSPCFRDRYAMLAVTNPLYSSP